MQTASSLPLPETTCASSSHDKQDQAQDGHPAPAAVAGTSARHRVEFARSISAIIDGRGVQIEDPGTDGQQLPQDTASAPREQTRRQAPIRVGGGRKGLYDEDKGVKRRRNVRSTAAGAGSSIEEAPEHQEEEDEEEGDYVLNESERKRHHHEIQKMLRRTTKNKPKGKPSAALLLFSPHLVRRVKRACEQRRQGIRGELG